MNIESDPKPHDNRLFDNQALYYEGGIKPTWRGYIHYITLFSGICVLALIELIKVAKTPSTIILSILFILSLIACYSASMIYHVCDSDKENEILFQKMDHIMISFFMYFTILPLSLILPIIPRIALVVLSTGFLILNLYNIYNLTPNLAYEIAIIAIGVLFFPFFYFYMTTFEFICACSVVVIDIIAGYYFFKEKNFSFISPDIFGYHEIFHFLSLIANIPGYFMIYSIIDRTSIDDVDEYSKIV